MENYPRFLLMILSKTVTRISWCLWLSCGQEPHTAHCLGNCLDQIPCLKERSPLWSWFTRLCVESLSATLGFLALG